MHSTEADTSTYKVVGTCNIGYQRLMTHMEKQALLLSLQEAHKQRPHLRDSETALHLHQNVGSSCSSYVPLLPGIKIMVKLSDL